MDDLKKIMEDLLHAELVLRQKGYHKLVTSCQELFIEVREKIHFEIIQQQRGATAETGFDMNNVKKYLKEPPVNPNIATAYSTPNGGFND